MANLATVEVGLRGPVNGMGESDLRGSYYQIALVFPDDEIVRGKMTLAQLQELRGVLDHFISVEKQDAGAVQVAIARNRL